MVNFNEKAIDCWDNCDCAYCQSQREAWINNDYNKRAVNWLKERERDKINKMVLGDES